MASDLTDLAGNHTIGTPYQMLRYLGVGCDFHTRLQNSRPFE